MKVLLESPEFFRTLGPETNGIFPSCFQTFSLSLALPPSPAEEEEEEGRKGRSVRVVTRYLRMSEVFHGCVASARARNPPVLSTGKIARDPTVYFGKYILGYCWKFIGFFFLFFEVKETYV